MGLFTSNNNEIKDKVHEKFGENFNAYLVALKHNSAGKQIFNLVVSNLFSVWEDTRQYILCFTNKGIYEKDISGSLNGDFILIPWNEIKDFSVEETKNHITIKIVHLGKIYAYKAEYNGKPFKGNEERKEGLKKIGWNREY